MKSKIPVFVFATILILGGLVVGITSTDPRDRRVWLSDATKNAQECVAGGYRIVQLSSTTALCTTPSGKTFEFPSPYPELLEYGGRIKDISPTRIIINESLAKYGPGYSATDTTIMFNELTVFYDSDNHVVSASYFKPGMSVSARGEASDAEHLAADWVKEYRPEPD